MPYSQTIVRKLNKNIEKKKYKTIVEVAYRHEMKTISNRTKSNKGKFQYVRYTPNIDVEKNLKTDYIEKKTGRDIISY